MVKGTIKDVYGNRNYKDKPSDKEINMILFCSDNHVAAGIFQFTCHPTVLGIHNMKISSDLMGNIGKSLDDKYNLSFSSPSRVPAEIWETGSTARGMTKKSSGKCGMKL